MFGSYYYVLLNTLTTVKQKHVIHSIATAFKGQLILIVLTAGTLLIMARVQAAIFSISSSTWPSFMIFLKEHRNKKEDTEG